MQVHEWLDYFSRENPERELREKYWAGNARRVS